MNKLTVRGTPRELNRFRTTVWKSEKEQLDFNATVPIPEELANSNSPNPAKPIIKSILRAKYGHDNWYDWQIANWGCKWNADVYNDPQEISYKNGTGALIYEYDTPWAPPSAWIMNTSKLFPSLSFSNYCNEPDMGFKGTETIMNGRMIKNTIK